MDVTKMLTTRRASALLDVSGNQVRRLCVAGELGYVPTELGWFIDPESVRAYMRRHPEKYPQVAAADDDEGSDSAVGGPSARASTQARRRTA